MIMRDLDFFMADDQATLASTNIQVQEVRAKVALSPSSLPGLDFALNPYIGCEHGCLYCFAPEVVRRDRAAWAIKVGMRYNLPILLAKELRTKRGVIGIGTVTDPYQPIEAVSLLTRKCILEISNHDNPVSVLTKSDLVVRDLELIERCHMPEVGITITTLDEGMAKVLEPGAPSPRRRLEALSKFSTTTNTYAMVGPLLPFLERSQVEELMQGIRSTGTDRVMIDRLRPRPGLEDVLSQVAFAEVGDRFRRTLDDPSHGRRVEGWVRDACLKLGLRLENAF